VIGRALRYGALFFVSPARAAAAARAPGALLDGALVYAAALAASALYLALKPFDFPDPHAALPAGPQGLVFWVKVMAWQPLLLAALVVFCAALRRWMADGWLGLKMAVAVLWTALPLILTVAYVKNALPKPAFGALMLLWAAPGVWQARAVPREEWLALAAYLLGLNAVELAALAGQALATLARSPEGYKAAAAAAGLWMIFGGAYGLKSLPPERPLARALMPLLFALILQIEVVAACYLLGWLPVETLKALMYG
jgi:hypothetical protein